MQLDPDLKLVKVYCRGITSYIPYNKAIILVDEGRAIISNEQTIKIKLSRKKFKRYILERDDYICQYCGRRAIKINIEMYKKYNKQIPDNIATVDHIIPRSKGGYSTPKNCVCACYKCNQEKGNKVLVS